MGKRSNNNIGVNYYDDFLLQMKEEFDKQYHLCCPDDERCICGLTDIRKGLFTYYRNLLPFERKPRVPERWRTT
jgi:hypothetical protein